MNIRQYAFGLFIFLLTSCINAQDIPARLQTGYAPLDDKLSSLVTADNQAISANEAYEMAEAIFLDARELDEFEVSHLPKAIHIGYDKVDYDTVEDLDLNKPVIVYCTVGYRSEKIAKKLRKKGFKNVYNLYGSLYAWKLAGYPLMDADGKSTERLHTYNKKWGSFVPDTIGEKVW